MSRLPTFALGAATAFALAATSAAAQDDPRLVTREYDAAKIVRIEGRPGVQATIVFAEDEKIENVAVGDSEKWQITPNKRANLLFARPLDAAAVTNMTVVTDKRTYLFDLVATAKDKPVYLFRFTYGNGVNPLPASEVSPPVESAMVAAAPQPVPPAEPVLAAAPRVRKSSREQANPAPAPEPEPLIAEAAPATSAIDDAIAASSDSAAPAGEAVGAGEEKLAKAEPEKKPKRVRKAKSEPKTEADAPQQAPVVAASEPVPVARPVTIEAPGTLNFAWPRDGKASLLPKRIYDDGMATYLIWGKNQTLPTVTVTDATGAETTPRQTSENNSIAIAGVPSVIVLRQGKSSAKLENLRPIQISTLPARQLSAQASSTSPSAGSN
ncbi:MAG: TrbG/VirB9 family P-type conjugative transfer protein [Novosphingobium sp.]|nr:TrbG/VirB9 family P-type conjugative transfer protein [Novosphingobium sp.]